MLSSLIKFFKYLYLSPMWASLIATSYWLVVNYSITGVFAHVFLINLTFLEVCH